MSTVEFHCATGGQAALGAEALEHLALACHRIAIALADPGSREALTCWGPLLAGQCALKDADGETFRAFFGPCWIGGGALGFKLDWRGWELDTLALSLNTALAVGGGPLQLAARIAGMNREQLWIDAPDRPWLDGLVARGLDLGLLPSGGGWSQVHALLAAHGGEPLAIADCERARARTQLTPASLAGHYFGDGISVLDLVAPDRTERLDRAFGFDAEAAPLPHRVRERR